MGGIGMTLLCQTTCCRRHLTHNGGGDALQSMSCFASQGAILAREDRLPFLCQGGQVIVKSRELVACLNFAPCESCPVCKPLPTWARDLLGEVVSMAIIEEATTHYVYDD